MNNFTPFLAVLVSFFFASGCFTYFIALSGTRVYKPEIPMYRATPLAASALLLGVSGLYTFSTSRKHFHSEQRRAWLQLLLGFIMILISWLLLDLLLVYTRPIGP